MTFRPRQSLENSIEKQSVNRKFELDLNIAPTTLAFNAPVIIELALSSCGRHRLQRYPLSELSISYTISEIDKNPNPNGILQVVQSIQISLMLTIIDNILG